MMAGGKIILLKSLENGTEDLVNRIVEAGGPRWDTVQYGPV